MSAQAVQARIRAPNSTLHHRSPAVLNLLCDMLQADPGRRPTAETVLEHPWLAMDQAAPSRELPTVEAEYVC